MDWEVWLDDRSDTAEPEDFADFTAATGTLTIDAGQTTETVMVGTAADTLAFETNEHFTLLLSNPVNATVADPTVRGTIVNRPPPAARTAFTALPSSNTEVVLAWEAATRESVVQAGVPSNTYVLLFIEMSLNAEITRHEYRYKTVGGAYPATWTAIADSASGGANAYGYTVAGLSNETVYKFQLRTVGVGGNGRPVTSNAVTPTPGICDRTPQVRECDRGRGGRRRRLRARQPGALGRHPAPGRSWPRHHQKRHRVAVGERLRRADESGPPSISSPTS